MSLSDSQKWLLLAAIGGLGFLLYLLSPILMPFFAAALLAYLGDPIADRLEMLKLPRTLAVVIVFVSLLLVLLALLLLLVPMLEHQISYLLSNFPKYVDIVQNRFLPGIANRLGIDPASIDLASIKTAISQHFDKSGGVMAKIFASVTRSGVALMAWLANLVLIPVVTFYLLRDWDIMTGRIREMLPRQYEPVIVRLAQESDQVLAAFLRGQFMVMLALGIIYSTGLWFIDLKLALLIGMLAGLVSFVPYL
ncbi:MAG TPA: AI-2E family transporter, partial [Pseudomonadales bacterium]